MAQPSTELNVFRQRVTAFLDHMDDAPGVLAPVEGAGTTDAERRAFFEDWIAAQGDYDIDADELIDAVIVLRNFTAWYEANLPALAKMRI